MSEKFKGWTMKPSYCPKCSKEFYPTPMWVYRDGRMIYCSWGCFNHRFDKAKKTEEVSE